MLLQLIINSIITSCTILLVALGFNIIYSTVRFFHFAHGAKYTLGAYFVFLFYKVLHLPLILSCIIAFISVSFIGLILKNYIYDPIKNRGGSPLILLLSSLGIYIVIQNTISLFFGNNTKSIRAQVIKEGIPIYTASITPIQIIIIFSSILLSFLTWLILKYSKIGKSIRAVANNDYLSTIIGINKNKIISFVFLYGSFLAAVAGVLVAFDTDLFPTMGFRFLMLGVIAVIIGGIGELRGTLLGSFILGCAYNFGVWKIPTQWQDSIVFFIFLVFLLFLPQGLFGKPMTKTRI
jgi:branched-chain amino acid transport system permease protein